jgi:hypothetical protein
VPFVAESVLLIELRVKLNKYLELERYIVTP